MPHRSPVLPAVLGLLASLALCAAPAHADLYSATQPGSGSGKKPAACGALAKLELGYNASHVVPFKTVHALKGFGALACEQQLEVANHPANKIGPESYKSKNKDLYMGLRDLRGGGRITAELGRKVEKFEKDTEAQLQALVTKLAKAKKG
jgi:hypothetical protein